MGKKWKKKMGWGEGEVRSFEGEGGFSGGGSRFRGGRGGRGGNLSGTAHGDRGWHRGKRSRPGKWVRQRWAASRNRPSREHHRSFYKGGADLKSLALKYPQLNEYLMTTDGGRTKIDFRNTKSLCVLAQVLAMKDFGLDLQLPSDRIVPNLQLRYNYLMWVEDLLEKWPSETRGEVVNGIDIGSNASVLYALVAAKKNNWKMLTSEYDEIMFNASKHNIRVNNLEKLVTVKKVDDRTFLEGIVDPNVPFYDFCMFSLPFFNNKEGRTLLGVNKGKPAQLNALTGRAAEVVIAGGEKNLMSNIIRESEKLKNKIKLFTIMVGRMSTVDVLGPELAELVGDDFVGTFVCRYGPQHTYGIAWTFDPYVKLKNANRLKFHIRSAKTRLEHTVNNTSLTVVFLRLHELLEEAMVNYKVIEESVEKYTLEISTYYKFWSKEGYEKAESFKKEFLKNDSEGPDAKKIKLDDSEVSSRSLSKVFHKGDTLIISAILEIVQQKEKENSVLIQIDVTGGVAGLAGGKDVLDYFVEKLSS